MFEDRTCTLGLQANIRAELLCSSTQLSESLRPFPSHYVIIVSKKNGPPSRWFAVKSCGESAEVGAMVISTDIFRVVSSRQSFVFELRTAEVIR